MLSNEALERVLERLQSRFDEVNSFYIRKIAEQIKKIGGLSQANINRLVIMADMTSDVREITERLMIVTRLNAQDIQADQRTQRSDQAHALAGSGGVMRQDAGQVGDQQQGSDHRPGEGHARRQLGGKHRPAPLDEQAHAALRKYQRAAGFAVMMVTLLGCTENPPVRFAEDEV